MKNIYYIIAGLCVWLPVGTSAMEFKIDGSNERIMLTIYNDSDDGAYVNRRLAIGASNATHEVELIIKTIDGRGCNISGIGRLRLPSEADHCWLQKGQFVGRCYKIADVAKLYELPPGEYIIKAIYKNKFQGSLRPLAQDLVSNDFTIIVKKQGESEPTGQPRNDERQRGN